jgi:hypothetical protein
MAGVCSVVKVRGSGTVVSRGREKMEGMEMNKTRQERKKVIDG